MAVIVSVIGARPQFIKAAPIELALAKREWITHYSVHTGQHYDKNMSDIFFDELGLSKPYVNLQVGSGSHAQQTAAIMTGLEPVLRQTKPDLLIVYGDTNSTMAAALVAVKMHIPVAHIESGLRSYNREMPEEINRIVTDKVSSILFAPSPLALKILASEGIENVYESGDVMMDMQRIAVEKNVIKKREGEKYYYATLHRPYNTDNQERLKEILQAMNTLDQKVIFSRHPRTFHLMAEYEMRDTEFENIQFIEPQGYFENLNYLYNSEGLFTDSGGMQKEAYFFEKRCITLRSETEWKETLENDCNTLVWDRFDEIKDILARPFGPFKKDLYGDGHAAEGIVKVIAEYLGAKQQGT